ncbi:MAG: ABC transporter ATP-binding protein [Intestinibacter sp.]
MSILDIKNISFSYDEKEILEDVSFSVGSGELFCILGPNGCGKSTLLDCLLGVNKISKGSIEINQKSINKYRAKEFAKNVSYVPQSHEKTFPYTVLNIVLMGRTHSFGFASKPSDKDTEDAVEVLKKIGIEDLKDRIYTSLSGGELQLVMIARAIFQSAKIIIMDEPTAHLDFFYENKVLKLISKLIKEENISVVMATHFLNHPFYFENDDIKTTVGIMNNKKMLLKGTPTDVITEKSLKDVYKINVKINELEYENKKYKQVLTLK